MRTTIYKSLVLAAASLVFAGCIEEAFLSGNVLSVSDGETVNVDQSVNGLAVEMMGAGLSGFYGTYGFHIDFGIPSIHIMTDSMLEDLVMCGDYDYNQYNNYAMNLGQGSTGAYASYFWICYYKWIHSANLILSALPAEDLSESDYCNRAKALTYRAMCYLDLARLYEPRPVVDPVAISNGYEIRDNIKELTVPIVTEKTTEDQAVDNPRVHRSVLYEFIISDLNDALDCFEAAGNPSSNTSPCPAVVYGLLARTYIEMGYWEDKDDAFRKDAFTKAADYASKVIAGGFSPLTETAWHDTSNGFNNVSTNTSWVWGLTLSNTMTNNLFNFTSMMSSEAFWGYAFVTKPGASSALYSSMSDKDFRKRSFYMPGSGLEYEFAGNSSAQAYTMKYITPYQSFKFRPARGECYDYSVGVAADHPLMRIEEMYFLAMEAKLRTDGLSAAKSLLEDFMNTWRISDGSYVCSAADEDEFVTEMILQKRAEFWGEGVLLYDYKRLNLGFDRTYEGTNFGEDFQFKCDERSPQWNICIPRSEIQNNLGITDDQNNPDPTQFAA
ncbi:MAG: RagB/SusD family nutrient uptake outer membrane protein [Candidatus Cryptobacteroides sp.]